MDLFFMNGIFEYLLQEKHLQNRWYYRKMIRFLSKFCKCVLIRVSFKVLIENKNSMIVLYYNDSVAGEYILKYLKVVECSKTFLFGVHVYEFSFIEKWILEVNTNASLVYRWILSFLKNLCIIRKQFEFTI